VESDEIVKTINSFPTWIYQFNLKGHLTPVADKNTPICALQRKNYFFDPLVELLGGSLKGKRVLDIGCNAGFWPLQAIESGCDFVLGIDGRQMHIDQSNFVFKANDINVDRYKFIVGNVFDLNLQELGHFDIVMCLGFFHHVSKQMQLLEKIAQVNSDIFLLETRVSRIPGSFMMLLQESTDYHVNALDYSLTMLPTKQAVIDMVRQFGYTAKMLQQDPHRHSAEPDYRLGRRKAFLCSKKTDLSNLSVEVETITKQSEFRDIICLVANWITNKIRRIIFP